MIPPVAPVIKDQTLQQLTVLRLLVILAKRKRLVLGLPLVAAVVSLVVVSMLPNIYTATARVMPPQLGQSALAASALSAITTITGGSAATLGPALGLKNPSDLYVGILRGHTVADRLIERFDLRKRFGKDTLVETRKALEETTVMRAGRDGLIVIAVDDEDPAMAAAIANGYVDELNRLTQELAVTEAAQRRLFLERELVAAREKLAASEGALRETQEKTGLIQPEGQAKAIFDAFTELRARIAAKEVELASLQAFATKQNPHYLRVERELASLRLQLSNLEEAQPGANGRGNILVPTTQVPEAGLEYLRRLREVRYHEALYELLVKQYEVARIEEARDAPLIQVVDRATPPDRKSKPKRALIVVLVVLSSLVVSVLGALLAESIDEARNDQERGHQLNLLIHHLGSIGRVLSK